MVDERKMVKELIEYQEKMVNIGHLEECVTVADIIRWVVEQPKAEE